MKGATNGVGSVFWPSGTALCTMLCTNTQGDPMIEKVTQQFDHAVQGNYGRSAPRPGPVAAAKPWLTVR